MKYFIIAGEPSGDLHGANLMRSILAMDVNASFRYWGGPHMSDVSDGKVLDIEETSIMGFGEVVMSLRKIRRFFKLTKESITDFAPDVVVFIDYPGFNLRMCKWAKLQGYSTVFYISPQLWAWKKGRKETIRKYVDELLVILPFEKAWYKKEGIDAHYVGHPLLEAIAKYSYQKIPTLSSQKPILALLPGSRKQEIKKMLPIMLEATSKLEEEYSIIVAGSPNMAATEYDKFLKGFRAIVVPNRAYDVLSQASFALVTSGTATLETAIHKVPQIVCYKTSPFNYQIGKRLVHLKYISLVNLILGYEAIPELIQSELNPQNIIKSMRIVMSNKSTIAESYSTLANMLTTDKPASEKAAEIILKLIKN